MSRQRGSPDRRGMGAQSDFIAETFVPNEQYRAQQLAMVRRLSDAGVPREQMKRLFLLPVHPPAVEDDPPS